MNGQSVDNIARAVLYEGYVLYPYRPCVKTRQRWTFGGIFPADYVRANPQSDKDVVQTQCLLEALGGATLSIKLRFLHLTDRIVQAAPDFLPVDSLRVGKTEYQSWQEAVEREIPLQATIAELLESPRQHPFFIPQSETAEDVAEDGVVRARLIRRQAPLQGVIHVQAERVTASLIRITAQVRNEASLPPKIDRDAAQLSSFASTHFVLHCSGGRFISLTDPPSALQPMADTCQNVGCWPVLVGDSGHADTLLASPIILPDYPQIAPESPGDLFDGCEIDEILTLRILTLTDKEKEQAAAVDPRVRSLMERTETLARDQLMNLHGALRNVGPVHSHELHAKPGTMPSSPEIIPWDPLEEHKTLEKALSAGIELRPGDRVTLRPRGGADIMDIALVGRAATIAAIEQDFENRIHLAVTIDDDPGNDFGAAGKPGHRFFFKPDEVEVLERRGM